MNQNHRIAIIGANGFVGKYIAKELKLKGYQFSTISIRSKTIKLNGRILNPKDFEIIDQSFDIIIDCSTPSDDFKNDNIYIKEAKDFLYLFKKFKFKGDYILFSSISVYSDKENLINQKTKVHPWDNYGRSKVIKEIQIKKIMYENNKNSKFHIVRPSGIIGIGMPETFIKRITDRALTDNDFFIYGYDYPFNAIINVENVAKIICELLDSNTNQVIVLGAKTPLKLKEISKIIKNNTNSVSEIKEKKVGREPFIINYKLERKYDQFILSTEQTLLKIK